MILFGRTEDLIRVHLSRPQLWMLMESGLDSDERREKAPVLNEKMKWICAEMENE